ncbi:MAG: prolyl oligopeptidase family serine peptidase [Pirellulaceae bacterium]|jgi:cephalosporin-C deacetylase-like acetyl esterase|nr:prolyl oligopeptidase family serine peptidase [Pirellulaceae bacterium]
MQNCAKRRNNANYFTRIQLLFALLMLFVLPRPAWAQTAEQIPWDMGRLSQAPDVEWIDQTSPVHSLFYVGEPFEGKPTQVFAYYASPSTLADDSEQTDEESQEKYPAVVLIHGGGGTAFREWAELWAERGYAAIAMDLAGSRPIEGTNPHEVKNRSRIDGGGPGQGDDEKFGSIDKPPGEQWPYHAVANAILAHSLVGSFDEVDAGRTAVTGISWGGYLTCIVAGVDSRFKAAVPVYGCGFLNENSIWLPRFASMTAEQRQRWVELWDPSQYLPRVTMPILFVNGTNDFAYPLDSYMKSFDAVPNQVPVNKQLCITVNMPHGHPQGWAPQEIGLFVDQYLKNGRPLPQVGTPQVIDGQVSVPVLGSTAVVSAELHATQQTGEINHRQWTSTTASVGGDQGADQVIAKALPTGTTAWFVTVQDDRGAVVSTRVEFALK